jgi:multicomponent Na+:H+ antiporter subunit B
VKSNPILRVNTRFLTPIIILFALYVQFHGDYSPGGGFQAGVIFSSAVLLFAMVFGLDRAAKALSDRILISTACVGVLLYAGTGVVSLILGGEYLNYSSLSETATVGQHIGIIVIELGVGLAVAAVMVLIFFTFARRIKLS